MCAIPKSMITGWPASSMTLPGLRSRCTTPAAWMAASASASPSARASSAMPRSGPSCLHRVLERPARHVPGHDVRRGALHVGVEHLGDVAVPDPAHGLNLAGESLPGAWVAGHGRPENLDGDPALLPVGAKVDNTHAPLADLLDHAVRADLARERIQCWHRPLRVRPVARISIKPWLRGPAALRGSLPPRGAHPPPKWPTSRSPGGGAPPPPARLTRRGSSGRWQARRPTVARRPAAWTARCRAPRGKSAPTAGRSSRQSVMTWSPSVISTFETSPGRPCIRSDMDRSRSTVT